MEEILYCSEREKPYDEISSKLLGEWFFSIKLGNIDRIRELIVNKDDEECYEGLCFAISCEQIDICEIIIQRGIDIRPNKTFYLLKNVWNERYTLMGLAILSDKIESVKWLVEKGICVDDVLYKKEEITGIDIYYQKSREKRNYNILLLLIESGSNIKLIKKSTIFTIGKNGSKQEIELLLNNGLDPFMIVKQSFNTDFKELTGWDRRGYRSEKILFDIVVMRAERNNIFEEDKESLEIVKLFLDKNIDISYNNNKYNQTYLHWVTIPELFQKLYETKIDIKKEALFSTNSIKEYNVLQVVSNTDIIDYLIKQGISENEFPYLPNSKAHKDALHDPKYTSWKFCKNALDGISSLIDAIKSGSIDVVVALLGFGIDLNRHDLNGSTILHWLFSQLMCYHISDEHDYETVSEDYYFRIINILIKHGAKPLRDCYCRTPLMRLNPIFNIINNTIIDIYFRFESNYYNIDHIEYKNKLHRLIYSLNNDIHYRICYRLDDEYLKEEDRSKSSTAYSDREYSYPYYLFWESFSNQKHFPPQISDYITYTK